MRHAAMTTWVHTLEFQTWR